MDFLSVKAQHSVGALDLETTDSTEANSIHVLDSKAMVSMDSKAQDSIVSGVAMDSIDALDLDVVSENVVATDSEKSGQKPKKKRGNTLPPSVQCHAKLTGPCKIVSEGKKTRGQRNRIPPTCLRLLTTHQPSYGCFLII